MAKCPSCGAEVADGMKFCCECGARIPQDKECPSCHTRVPIEMKFCPECGHKLSGATGAGSVLGGSRHTVECHVCGRSLSIIDANTCIECHQYACNEHYDKVAHRCQSCLKGNDEDVLEDESASTADDEEDSSSTGLYPEMVSIPDRDYKLGCTPVTQAQWKAVMGTNPSKFKGANRPVENVSWYDCLEYIDALNERTGLNFRLPTSDEWAYACLAGLEEDEASYGAVEGGREGRLDDIAWHAGNSGGETHPVAQKQPNAWGLYDMHGNVNEWCWDAYSDKGYQGDGRMPFDADSYKGGLGYAYVGGCFNDNWCGCETGNDRNPDYHGSDFGFRLALDSDGDSEEQDADEEEENADDEEDTSSSDGLFSVILKDCSGSNKGAVLRDLVQITGMGLMAIGDMLDNLPAVIAKGVSHDDAAKYAVALMLDGAKAEVVADEDGDDDEGDDEEYEGEEEDEGDDDEEDGDNDEGYDDEEDDEEAEDDDDDEEDGDDEGDDEEDDTLIDFDQVREYVESFKESVGCDDIVLPDAASFDKKWTNLSGVLENWIDELSLDPDDAIAIIDCTVFGSAKNGVLIDKTGIYTNNDDDDISGWMNWESFKTSGRITKDGSYDVHLLDDPLVGINVAGCRLSAANTVKFFTGLLSLVRGEE